MTYFIDTIDYKRECGSCAECCKGWLTGNIYEYTMHPHNPCHFVDTNRCDGCCTIYEHRPQMCSNYQCVWKQQPVLFPEWMKPEKSKVIVTQRYHEDAVTKETIKYWQVLECGQTIDPSVLNWILRQIRYFDGNVSYQVAGQWFYLGSETFVEIMTGSKEPKLDLTNQDNLMTELYEKQNKYNDENTLST